MATWNDLSKESISAARHLLQRNRLRSSMSRAYYAAYSAVAGRMVAEGVSFPRGWNNPAHNQLVPWLRSHAAWSINCRRQLANALQRLRNGREIADYRPGMSLSRGDVIELLKGAELILRLLEVRQ